MEKEKKPIGVKVHCLGHKMKKNFTDHARSMGAEEMALMHGWIIRYLAENPEQEIYQKDIEKYFSMGKSTVANAIQVLEKQNYLSREAGTKDARFKRVVLTEKGRNFHNKLEEAVDYVNAKSIEGIDEHKLAIFFEVIELLEKNIEKQQQERAARKEETND